MSIFSRCFVRRESIRSMGVHPTPPEFTHVEVFWHGSCFYARAGAGLVEQVTSGATSGVPHRECRSKSEIVRRQGAAVGPALCFERLRGRGLARAARRTAHAASARRPWMADVALGPDDGIACIGFDTNRFTQPSPSGGGPLLGIRVVRAPMQGIAMVRLKGQGWPSVLLHGDFSMSCKR